MSSWNFKHATKRRRSPNESLSSTQSWKRIAFDFDVEDDRTVKCERSPGECSPSPECKPKRLSSIVVKPESQKTSRSSGSSRDSGCGSSLSPSTSSENTERKKYFRRRYRRDLFRKRYQSSSTYSSGDPRFGRFLPSNRLPVYDLRDLEKLDRNVTFIDTHCQLDSLFSKVNFTDRSFAKFQRQNEKTFPSCYEGCVTVFSDPRIFHQRSLRDPLMNEDGVWASFGCHPCKADLYNEETELDLLNALDHRKVVALGKIGLDYSEKNSCPRWKQKEVFRRQLQIAVTKKIPLVIHCRDSDEDTFVITKSMVPRSHKIHFHCFNSGWREAQRWLHYFHNLFIGFTPLVTYEDAKEVHEVASRLPLNRLLLETDSPYFPPRLLDRFHDWRNDCSHPGMAIHVAAQVAKLKGVAIQLVLRQTRINTNKMYKI